MTSKATIITLTITLLLTGGIVPSVHAQAAATNPSESSEMQTMELNTSLPTKKALDSKSVKDAKMAEKDAMKASASANKAAKAFIMNADLKAVTPTSMTVMKDGKTYTVTLSTKTKLRRNFGGLSTIQEFSVGNKVDIMGTWTDETTSTIAATNIRNRSIMKRHGVFIGEVVSKAGNTLVLKSKNRENQTLTVGVTTKYIDREEKPMTLADVATGHIIRVKGMWDKSNNTVTQITQIKDFTLPAKASVSAMPTDVASPSANL